MNTSVIVGDTDGLIALISPYDIHSDKALSISKMSDIHIVFPNTAIAEAITTLQRKLSQPRLAENLANDFKNNIFPILYIDQMIMDMATELFNPHGSKQNTFFDALVAATAKKLGADMIFSFDGWYEKIGFQLAGDLVK